MYDRNYAGKILTFEASGGLINSSLVMQDRETNSFWSIMRGKSLAGELLNTPLKEIAENTKMSWGEWRRLHPDTLVLSVNGIEDKEPGYDAYYQSEDGYQGVQASDDRLATKTAIFAFRMNGHSYAVEHANIINGKSFELAGESIFLHRSSADGLHDSTKGFRGKNLACEFQRDTEEFAGTDCPQALIGFDTFWYNWSLNNPETELLN